MAVAREDTGTNVVTNNANVSTQDLTTLTVGTGSNRCLIGLLSLFINTSISGITMTWDPAGTNQAMTQVGTFQLSPNGLHGVAIFQLVAPTAGNKTLRASWTGTGEPILGAIEFSGVNQTTPVITGDNVTGSGGSGTTATITVTSATGDATVAVDATNDGTPVMNQTVVFQTSTTDNEGGSNWASGGASNVHTDSASTAMNWVMSGIHVQAVATVTTTGGPALFRVRLRQY